MNPKSKDFLLSEEIKEGWRVIHGAGPDWINSDSNNVNWQDRFGRTALFMATFFAQVEQRWVFNFFRHLIEWGADVNHLNKSSETPLIWALSYRLPLDIIELLLDAGASPTARNQVGLTCLMLACQEYPDAMPLLCQFGASLDERLNVGSNPNATVWDIAKENKSDVTLSILEKIKLKLSLPKVENPKLHNSRL